MDGCRARRETGPTVLALPSLFDASPLDKQRSTTPSSATSNAKVPSGWPWVSYKGSAPGRAAHHNAERFRGDAFTNQFEVAAHGGLLGDVEEEAFPGAGL